MQLQRLVNVCNINIDPITKKLIMTLNLTQTDFFRSEDLTISDISINPGVNPHRMVYFHILKRHSRDDIAEEIRNVVEVEGPIAGILNFERDGDQPINRIEGNWYDLNGVFSDANTDLWSRTQGIDQKQPLPLRGTILFERVTPNQAA